MKALLFFFFFFFFRGYVCCLLLLHYWRYPPVAFLFKARMQLALSLAGSLEALTKQKWSFDEFTGNEDRI